MKNKEFTNKWKLLLRSGLLAANFFLIITSLYHLKPASRSLILDSHGVEALPYVWIGSAIVLLIAIVIYQRLLERNKRVAIVQGTLLVFIGLLILFWSLLQTPGEFGPVAFYIFVDLFGVVLVEQFWSLTNSTYSIEEGKRWYGVVGTGGLLGGVAGGGAAAAMIKFTPLQTADLLLVTVIILTLILFLTSLMARQGIYREYRPEEDPHASYREGFSLLLKNRYLLLITASLLLMQVASPLVEYQFMGLIETKFPDVEERTALLSIVFSLLSGVSIFVNLVVTPLVLRYLGILAGLMVQPIILASSAYGFLLYPSLIPAVTMKISDRGFSYSISRATKELLYIPIPPATMFRAKAWIDMFGYRLFKVGGSMLILLLTQWTAIATDVVSLGWVIMVICLMWMLVLYYLHREYLTISTSRPWAAHNA